MNTHPAPSYEPKLDRLMRIRKIDSLRDLTLPLFPIDPLSAELTSALTQENDPVSAYAASLAREHPQLAQAVEKICGPAPWIVRSAGIEDLLDHINAGGYESLICSTPQDLTQRVAAVALSGSTDHARRQQALSEQSVPSEAIACFVQPLLKLDVAADVGSSHAPYLADTVIDRIEAVCATLMEMFDFTAIDCEWGLETALGFVSITTIMPRDPGLMNTAHTIGFGYACAQNTGSRATSLALRPAGTRLRLWRGRHLRETPVQRLHLLQARPAHPDLAFRERAALTDRCYDTLARHYDVAPAALLMLGAKSHGHALIAPDLMSAWRQYLALDTREQVAVAVAIVDDGNAEEHAGIMFRQQKVTCVRADTRCVPAGADCAVFDRGTSILGDSTMLQSIQTEVRRELILPSDCAIVFTDEVLTPTGELTPDCAEALSQLHRLPVDKESKARLLARTEQPMATLWMQRIDGAVQSPSLFAQIERARHSGDVGEHQAHTEFAKIYARAAQGSSSAPRRQFPRLFALSSDVGVLADSKDLRLTIALQDVEAATSWVPPATLSRLLCSAAIELAARRPDSALQVLECVTFISAQCARLPIYEIDEVVACLDGSARAYASGLSTHDMASIHSLGLPISSAMRLALRVLKHPAALKPLETFRQAIASLRGIASAGDTAALLSQQLNDAYSGLRDALGKAELQNITEPLRGALIEIYDASLKSLLARAVDRGDAVSYQRYLEMMQQWIALLRVESRSSRDNVVLDRFLSWLHRWEHETMPKSFEIEDRNWRAEFDTIAAAGEAAVRYENPHVLHNLLHQWSLAGLCIDTRELPRRVRSLERFCSTFSSRSTKVLRFEQDLLEIQIPMGTHKASYTFTPRLITVEWTEPPDCPSSEIARILAFEVLLERFGTWMFPGLTVRREQVLGTWTLFIRFGVPASGRWRHEDFTRFVAATRFLFDASYDFSYVASHAIDGFAQRFNGPAWEAAITTLVQYRTVFDDSSQYVALHTSPLSSAVSAIAQSRVARGLILRCLRGGIDRCWALIDRYSIWLGNCAKDDDHWHDRYEYLRQACLLLAARWPREALAALARRDSFHIGHDGIAACLFKRSDLKDDLLRAMTAEHSAHAGVSALIVRHAPAIAVTACGAAPLAARLADTGARFRRAKHFLVAHFADRIDPAVLGHLLHGMDTVPIGHTATTERAIRRHIPAGGPTCRFRLERGIDWTALQNVTTIAPTHR